MLQTYHPPYTAEATARPMQRHARSHPMTKPVLILMFTVTLLAASGCYAHAGYYAEPMYAAPMPVYVVPIANQAFAPQECVQ